MTGKDYQNSYSSKEQWRTFERKSTLLSCGCQEPHEHFLGVDHYLNNRSSSDITGALGRKRAVSIDRDLNNDNGHEEERNYDYTYRDENVIGE